ncbi:lysine-specific histone demethylase 13 [Dorcoceras hygrometricum]|uniref:Lysine-specific histone demethylase 13 n=1 Tax=Dorcoceras hygrometricum TaxID=472368 RepID=A0A2Z7AKA1_9LAMI|nr:lysine-specific histone demethylase 13 [Dorcoceras hygrometricum]
MEEKENQIGLKRKSLFDSGDDEPIGALMKLKGKKRSKPSKLVPGDSENMVKSVVEDEELGDMEDTLADFRKKLRGPKKDSGTQVVGGKDSSNNLLERESANDGRLVDMDKNCEGQPRDSRAGSSPGDATVFDVLKVKAKRKSKRDKPSSDAKTAARDPQYDGNVDYRVSRNCPLPDGKEDTSELGYEAVENSLSSLSQRVQSDVMYESWNPSGLKQVKETKVFNVESKPNSITGSDASPVKSRSTWKLFKNLPVSLDRVHVVHGPGSINSTLIHQSVDGCSTEDLNGVQGNLACTDSKQELSSYSSVTNHLSSSNDLDGTSFKVFLENPALAKKSHSRLRECSGKVYNVQDGDVNSETTGELPGSNSDRPCSNNIHDRSCGVSPVEADNSSLLPLDEGVTGACNNKYSKDQMNSTLMPKTEKINCTSLGEEVPGFCLDKKCLRKRSKDLCQTSVKASNGLLDHTCSLNCNYPSEDDEVNQALYSSVIQDHQESYKEETGSMCDSEAKQSSISVIERVARNSRKCRHEDMAYEGDADWEILMQGQEFLVSHGVVDKTKEKVNSSMAVDAENGKAAAVMAGLKARAVSPIEKIKFKEVLKRKGGLQEYLECRNHILSAWNKDVSRILSLTDFGVSNTPLVGEGPHASLIRDVHTFLDQRGYVNFGVPSGKENVETTKQESELLKSKETAGLRTLEDGVCFIHGKENTYVKEMNYDSFTDELPRKCKRLDGLVNLQALESSTTIVSEGFPPEDSQLGSYHDPISQNIESNMEYMGTILSCKDADNTMLPAMHLPDRDPVPDEYVDVPKERPTVVLGSIDCGNRDVNNDSEPRKGIIIIGAGPAGLTAARHLQRQGFDVIVLEARSRIGGRVYTDRSSLSVPVDLGASIITGVEADVAAERRPDPSSLVSSQLGLELTVLNSDCPLYDIVTGQKVPADLDEALEAEYNSLLDDMVRLVTEKGEHAMKMSLEEGLEYGLKRCRLSHSVQDNIEIASDKFTDTVRSTDIPADDVLIAQDSKSSNPLERRVMDWHFAHLEYGCAALLQDVSLPNWNQDDAYGGFGGAHCMIKGGYSAVVESLGEGLCIYLDHVVTKISYDVKCHEMNNDLHNKVKISTSNGKEFSGDAVLVTVPLGCLKAETIKFSPPLPEWKYQSVQRLGFGVLNKVVLEFSEVFWDDTIDYFGATAETSDQRGRCFMFWNVKKTVGAPVLISLVVGMAAIEGQNISPSDHVNHALLILRKLFGEERVSDPVASVVTDWGRDPYCYGAYSYVAVGASGEDYDILGRPVDNCLFFAGEATCKEHPDTVGGAMISGLREAVRIMDILKTGTDYTTEMEAMEAAKRHSDIGKSEMRDIVERLEALEFSDGLRGNSLDASRLLTRGSMLKDMFFMAKTSAGRLCLVKELLSLPVGFLKTFASTKEGLSVLNSWILDSLGKDGTQLLRHCVRLLVLISTDLLAVRLSGIGKTVKEKVCVHTSRDIRAIASQLVNVWVELFRKDKASKGGLKLLRQSTTLDSKSKTSLVSGKPPRRTIHVAPESKGSSKVSASAMSIPSSERTKKVVDKTLKSETRIDPKTDGQLPCSHGSLGSQSVVEEKNQEIPISEEESAAIAAAEAAQAAAIAAAKAYAASGVMRNTLSQLPKILSFHKFAMHEQWTHMDESDIRKNLSGAAIGKQDFLSDIDSRNCRVRDWSVDFSAAGINLENSRVSVDNHSQQSRSNEIASQLNFGEHSGENAAVDSSIFTRAWVDSAGSVGIKDYNAIDRWQNQAAAASSGFSHGTMHLTDEEDSNVNSKLHARKSSSVAIESSASHVAISHESKGNQPKGAERLKHAVVDYVASLLMPLYKARKIDREGYKSIMKKTATKVMEHTNDVEKAMAVSEFLDFRRKNKVRVNNFFAITLNFGFVSLNEFGLVANGFCTLNLVGYFYST